MFAGICALVALGPALRDRRQRSRAPPAAAPWRPRALSRGRAGETDGDLWLPPSKERVVDDLVEAVEERASVMLTGDPGVGKTTVLRAVRHRLGEGRFRLTYCHNATLGRRDFHLKLAGCDREVFASDAVAIMHEAALGSLREVDRIATHSLPGPATRSASSSSATSSRPSSPRNAGTSSPPPRCPRPVTDDDGHRRS